MAGGLIGLVLIVLDNKFHFWNGDKSKEGEYRGPIEADKENMYVTTASYSETSWDFGKIKEGDTAIHKFIITNTGKDPCLFIRLLVPVNVSGLFAPKIRLPLAEHRK